MKANRILGASAALLLIFGAATGAQAYVKSTWFNAANAPHKVVSGSLTTFKAVCDDPAAITIEVTLAGEPVASGTVANSFAIESNPVYLTAGGSYSITVRDAGGASLGTDTYAVTLVAAPTVTDAKEIAIENGLWYLHKSMIRYATVPNGAPGGRFNYNGNPDGSSDASTLMGAQAFVDAGHVLTVSADNPYVEDVQRLVNFVTEHLRIMSFAANPKDGGLNPEGRSSTTYGPRDNLGVFFAIDDGSSEIEYGFGPALKFLATCGYTRTSTARPAAWDNTNVCAGVGSANLMNWTFPQIMQQMVDFIAWAQLYSVGNDYHADMGDNPTFCPNKSTQPVALGSRGGWPYFNEGWKADPADEMNIKKGGDGTYGDVAVAYWTVQGLLAAQTTLNSTNIYPTYVKTDVLTFTSNHVDPITGEVAFGPAHNIHLLERAGMGLSLLHWSGVTSASDTRVSAIVNFIKRNWTKHIYHAEQGHPEANYICHDETGVEKQCYQHFLMDANPGGIWVCKRYNSACEYEIIETLDDLNILAFKTVSEGIAAYGSGLTNIPAAAPNDHRTVYRGLLLDNQLPPAYYPQTGGAWTDHGWVTGYLPMGTGWATSLLAKLL